MTSILYSMGHSHQHQSKKACTTIGNDGHDEVEPQHSIGTLGIQADKRIGNGNDQDGKQALQNGINCDFGQVEGCWVVKLVLRLTQKDSPLCWKGIRDSEDGEKELGKDQEEAGEQANLNAGHVALELNEDQPDEQGSRYGLHGSHDGESLVALHIHSLNSKQV